MLGAIIGDMVGSVYEFANTKRTDFPLFSERSTYTDDTIMTVAVAQWLLSDFLYKHDILEDCLVKYANRYPHPMGGYGGGFAQWLFRPERLIDYRTGEITGRRVPYNSWGNGSAMRVSAVGWMFATLKETEKVAEISASITHDHPEGIKGAQATAAAIWMARQGYPKSDIAEYITNEYGYDLTPSCEQIRKTYGWEDSCQGTVPAAICAFLDSTDFESAIRLAVSLGGDSDTLACITGGIAEAYYKYIPTSIFNYAKEHLPQEFMSVVVNLASRSSYGDVYDGYFARNGRNVPKVRVDSPKSIGSLMERQIFVFGSNKDGLHRGGAARAAYERFGAVWGKGTGHYGQTYAIPTMQGGVETIRPYVDEFIAYARNNPHLTFLVTRIGCGIAGFKDEEIAPLFIDSIDLPNVLLPESFNKVLLGPYNMDHEVIPMWNIEWVRELPRDIPLTEEQYRTVCKGFTPNWDFRFAPIMINGWIYMCRSGFWLEKIRYERQDDGMYHIAEKYCSMKCPWMNILLMSYVDGYYGPRREGLGLDVDTLREAYEQPRGFYVRGKPEKCICCSSDRLMDVLYGEPSERPDESRYILGGCCIDEYSHNWECPKCNARYRDDSLW